MAFSVRGVLYGDLSVLYVSPRGSPNPFCQSAAASFQGGSALQNLWVRTFYSLKHPTIDHCS